MSGKSEMEEFYEGFLAYFQENPNTSPLKIINECEGHFPPGFVAGVICVLRESGKLTVTGDDDNGVLLSVA